MKSSKFTPITLLSMAAVIGFGMSMLVTFLAVKQPWLGLHLGLDEQMQVQVVSARGPSAHVPFGTILNSIRGGTEALTFDPLDLTIEPDGAMGDYRTYEQFLSRQDQLWHILSSDSVRITGGNGATYEIKPAATRPIASLPVEFWVQVAVGLIAWLISSAVFAFRTREISARYLLVSGASTLVFASFAAVYSTRELALPADLFKFLNDGNFLGGSIFSAVFVGLLLTYPKRIGPSWIGLAVVAVFGIWFVAQQLGAFESMTFARRIPPMLALFTTFALAAVHWFGTRTQPAERAALKWFLISWMLGTSVFGLFILLPQLFGVDTSAMQGFAFSLFVLVYIGLAFGILRFRLFELGEWWGQIVAWTATVFVLVVLDLLFLFGLQFSSEISLSLALLISGVIWLPVRSIIWNRFLGPRNIDRETVFERVVDVALMVPGDNQQIRWEELIRSVFDPLHLESRTDQQAAETARDGVGLVIPAVQSIAALRLEYADGGRRLFGPGDVAFVEELVSMLRHTLASRSAHLQGGAEERQRIALDIHDNIGSQLLSALHSPDIGRKDVMIRESLSDLRDIINNTSPPGTSFEETLANLRAETDERLSASEIEMEWRQKHDDVPPVSSQAAHAIRSFAREAVSNIIRHAGASKAAITIGWNNDVLTLSVKDNGRGFDAKTARSGNGLANLETRVSALGGSLKYASNNPGLSVDARIPIQASRRQS